MMRSHKLESNPKSKCRRFGCKNIKLLCYCWESASTLSVCKCVYWLTMGTAIKLKNKDISLPLELMMI